MGFSSCIFLSSRKRRRMLRPFSLLFFPEYYQTAPFQRLFRFQPSLKSLTPVWKFSFTWGHSPESSVFTERHGDVGSGNPTLWSIQWEPSLLLSINRRLQLLNRLWLEWPLWPLPSSTPLQVLLLLRLSKWLLINDFNSHWNGSFCRVASTVDAVLLSHSDTLHLGALPYAMKQFGLSAPFYSTEPVHRLGLLTMYDHYLSRKVKVYLQFFIWFIFGA